MWRALIDDVSTCLRFYSRLPLAATASGDAPPDLARLAPVLPIAGALIGAVGATSLVVARVCHLSPLISALIAVATLALTTGALHEDGLADVADGFGGGAMREAKLAIMRDSRTGAYGALALCLSVLLRAAAIATLVERSLLLTAFALVFAGALSRVAGLMPMLTLAPARADGAGAATAPPSRQALKRAFALAASLALAPWAAGAGAAQLIVAIVAAFAGAALIARLAEKQIGGYTGDVLGAAQQVAEIAILLSLSAA